MTENNEPTAPDHDLAARREPGPAALSEMDEAFVSRLLAGLPDRSMPPALAARIDAALAALDSAEVSAAAVGDQQASMPAAAEPAATATVVPFTDGPRRTSRWRSLPALQVAAVAVLVVAGGVVGVRALSGQSPSAGANTSAGGAAAASAKPVITRSNRAYTATTLVADVRTLVAGGPSLYAPAASGASPLAQTAATVAAAPTATKPLDPALRALTASSRTLGPCVTAIEDGLAAYVAPIAIDAGTYNGKPALLVVLPGSDDPTAYDVWIVGPACGTNKDAALIRYQSVPRG